MRGAHASTLVTCPQGLERRNMASSLSQGLATFGNVCTTVSRAAEKVEEEWSPHSVDVLVFHTRPCSYVRCLNCGHVTNVNVRHPSLMPRPCAPPGEKRSGERSQIPWAYYPKRVMTNEISRSVIIT